MTPPRFNENIHYQDTKTPPSELCKDIKVIIRINGECFRYILPKKYLKYSNTGQIVLPTIDDTDEYKNIKFNSYGYINRLCEREWSDFVDVDENVIEHILSMLG